MPAQIEDRTVPCRRPGCIGRVLVNNDQWHLRYDDLGNWRFVTKHEYAPAVVALPMTEPDDYDWGY